MKFQQPSMKVEKTTKSNYRKPVEEKLLKIKNRGFDPFSRND